MKKIVFLLAIVMAFAFDQPASKATCTAPVVPVCFNPALPGTTRCASHPLPPAPPGPCYCNATILVDGVGMRCMAPCVNVAAQLCAKHNYPPITDSIPK